MSKGSQSSTTTSTSQYKPPGYLGTDVKTGLQDATDLYNAGAPKYYPGQTYAGFDPLQTEAMNDTVNLARTGSPVVAGAQNAVQSILDTPSGSNPYLDNYLNLLAQQNSNTVNSTFNAAGRFGSGANASTAATAISNAQLPFLFNQYNTDQSNKLTAAGEAPGLANYDFTNLARIGTVGDAKQAMAQQGITQDVNKYNYNAGAPEEWLNQYLSQLQSSPANNWGIKTDSQTQETQSGSPLGSILGTGLALASMFTGAGPLAALGSMGGMSAGAGIGSLLGGLSSGGGGIASILSMIPGAVGRGVQTSTNPVANAAYGMLTG